MRLILAALALAGAMGAVRADGMRGTSFYEVTRAVACPAPMRCAGGRIARADHVAIIAMVDAEAARQGVPVRIARALVKVESGFNPRARNADQLGLTQIKCSTAKGLGFAGPCAALFDPAINLRWGLMHARKALDRGSIGFHQTGLYARGVTAAYVAKINRAVGR